MEGGCAPLAQAPVLKAPHSSKGRQSPNEKANQKVSWEGFKNFWVSKRVLAAVEKPKNFDPT